jgi:hypothetical protein
MTAIPQRWALFARRQISMGIVYAFLAVLAWYISAYPRGMLVACFDQARGHYEIQATGLPAPWRGETARLLQTRYGVELRTVAACLVPLDVEMYVSGYSAVSEPHMLAHFGKNVLAECKEEARIAYDKKNPSE